MVGDGEAGAPAPAPGRCSLPLLLTGLSREWREGDLYDLDEVIWLRSAAPDPGLKNSLREAIVLGEQQGIPPQKAAKVRQ